MGTSCVLAEKGIKIKFRKNPHLYVNVINDLICILTILNTMTGSDGEDSDVI